MASRNEYQPCWLYFVPFLRPVPILSRRQWHILGLIAIASVFDRYDLAILQLALPRIQTGLGIADADVSGLAALVRLGALPAFLIVALADRLGRRRLLIFTVVGYTLFTGATAFAPNAGSFAALQFIARTFITAELLLAVVVIAEEFPPNARGWGIGSLHALAAYGFAIGAVLFSLVDVLPFGWRALYLIGLIPLAIVARFRSSLPETERFLEHTGRQKQDSPSHTIQPLISMVRAYPGRFLILGAVILLVSFASEAALFFDPTYLQEAHDWQPWQVTVLMIGVGVAFIFASARIGQWGDRFGRKRMAVITLLAMPVFIIAFYNTFGPLLPVFWTGMIIAALGVQVSLSALGSELFPTSYRSTVTGAHSVVRSSGSALSLVAHGALFGLLGSQWTAVSVLAVLIFLAPFIVAIGFPETSGRALEDIAPER